MKYSFVILIFFLLASCAPKTVDRNGGLIFEIEIENHEKLEETINILKDRVAYFHHSNLKIIIDSIKKIARIELPGEFDSTFYKFLIESKGNFEILETYDNREYGPRLWEINSFLVENDNLGLFKDDTSELIMDYPLFSILQPMVWEGGQRRAGATIGISRPKDTLFVNRIFNTDPIKFWFPRDLEFKWCKNNRESYFSLIAIKKPVNYIPISNEMIEKVKISPGSYDDYLVLVALKPEYHSDLEMLTAKNIGNSLAVVLDNKVYASPMVQEVIKGGNTNISANFSEKQARILAALLSSNPLSGNLKIRNLVMINKP